MDLDEERGDVDLGGVGGVGGCDNSGKSQWNWCWLWWYRRLKMVVGWVVGDGGWREMMMLVLEVKRRWGVGWPRWWSSSGFVASPEANQRRWLGLGDGRSWLLEKIREIERGEIGE